MDILHVETFPVFLILDGNISSLSSMLNVFQVTLLRIKYSQLLLKNLSSQFEI